MIWILLAGLIFSFLAGVVYPAGAVIWYKILYRSRVSVKDILKYIGW